MLQKTIEKNFNRLICFYDMDKYDILKFLPELKEATVHDMFIGMVRILDLNGAPSSGVSLAFIEPEEVSEVVGFYVKTGYEAPNFGLQVHPIDGPSGIKKTALIRLNFDGYVFDVVCRDYMPIAIPKTT